MQADGIVPGQLAQGQARGDRVAQLVDESKEKRRRPARLFGGVSLARLEKASELLDQPAEGDSLGVVRQGNRTFDIIIWSVMGLFALIVIVSSLRRSIQARRAKGL